jgi:hypothetical protein
MILKYKIHSKFYCVVYSIMIYLLHTNTRLGRLWYHRSFFNLRTMSPGVSRRDSVITKELLFFYIKQVLISVMNVMSWVVIVWGRWEKIRGGAAV